jgi:hypothetical protein
VSQEADGVAGLVDRRVLALGPPVDRLDDRTSAEVMWPSLSYSTSVEPQTSAPPPKWNEMPAAGGLLTKANVTVLPVAAAHALTSSAVAIPFRNTWMAGSPTGPCGHRSGSR